MASKLFLRSLLFAGAFCAQPNAPTPKAAPIRELPWGQLNFLHTTDTHGWHGGHLQEPSYSADWGDYISFSKHLRDKADADGSDLLLIDTGDRIEGNGLYDASDPKGKYTFDIFKEQEIDVICSGNHELYQKNSSNNEFYQTVPNFKGNYLASNLDIYNPKTGELEALAPRFRKFTTKNQGIRVLAFGFLFDFSGNANNTVVKRVEDTTKEKWFQDAIRDRDVDLILVIGHVAIRSKEYDHLFKTIRAVQWDTPLQFFGGHTHIRDYKVYDSKSVALESGRYMETIGFQSITGLKGGSKKSSSDVPSIPAEASAKKLAFARRYIDNNLFSLHHHSAKNSKTFATTHGRNVTEMITSARSALKLDHRHGCAPQNLWVNRAPYPSNASIFTWLQDEVLPGQLSASTRVQDDGKKAIVITNTGAMRFDIFQGPFTKDSTFLVSPFVSGFRFVKDVPYADAMKILPLLNKQGRVLTADESAPRIPDLHLLAPPEQMSGRMNSRSVISESGDTLFPIHNADHQIPFHPSSNKDKDHGKPEPPNVDLTPGYTTVDDLGEDGDDTVHAPIAFYAVPNCIQATLGFSEEGMEGSETPEEVDLVFNEFVQPWILLALKYLGQEYDKSDTRPYMEGSSLTSVITDWVSDHWDGGAC